MQHGIINLSNPDKVWVSSRVVRNRILICPTFSLYLMQVWVSSVLELSEDVNELDSNGKLISAVEVVVVNCQKLQNMYQGITNPNIYEMSEAEIQVCACVHACKRVACM
jgi:hypothetical protein